MDSSSFIPAFNSPKRRRRYERIIESWRGTPYKHLVCMKGRGADCTLLVAGCVKELGILKRIEHDYYPRHWHMATTKEWVLESFDLHIKNHLKKNFTIEYHKGQMEESEFLFGDTFTFSTTAMGVSNHCAIWMDNGRQMFNSIHGRGCCYLTYGSYWKNRMTGVFRVMEKV